MFLTSGAVVVVALLIKCTEAQASASLSDCHNHGDTRYCVLPNGEETAVPESITAAPSVATAVAAADAQTTAVTDCHMHETAQFCVRGDGGEVMAMVTAGAIEDPPPAQYTGCHSHGEELFCYGPDSEETLFAPEAAAAAIQTGASSEGQEEESSSEGRNCHFHAGVEHCLEPGETEGGLSASAAACEKIDRSYDMPIRIGTLFLLTHAELMFKNPCLGPLKYEATTTAIVMAGAFLTFLLQYSSFRLTDARSRTVLSKSDSQHAESINGDTSVKSSQSPAPTVLHNHRMPKLDDPLSVLILEAGIIFHSAIIGVTLVVAGDSFYRILVVVIIFHQMFEGLALGVRISHLTTTAMLKKLLMGSAFALITPLGMAIGLGVLDTFNGKDRSTIIAIGTLDAFSAGILLWTGFVQMWSFDWLYGDLRDAGAVKTGLGMFALISGMVLMSLLGKWA
ncbi:MAG: hypothetical protein Q9215_006117 [Flavoplaca cf. flavocitrina]